MKIILDRSRIDAAGMVVATNAIMREVIDQLNMLSEDLTEDTLISIDINLCTRKYFDEMKAKDENANLDKSLSKNVGGTPSNDPASQGDGFSEGEGKGTGEGGSSEDNADTEYEPADLSDILDGDDDPLKNALPDNNQAPEKQPAPVHNTSNKKKHGGR